jgi:hypothetical protein
MSSSPYLDAVRAYVISEIQPHLPEGWDVVDQLPEAGKTLTKTSVFLDYSGIEPLPEDPLGQEIGRAHV